jgi:hypothetical protein
VLTWSTCGQITSLVSDLYGSHRSSPIFTGFSSSSRLRSHHGLPRHIGTTPDRRLHSDLRYAQAKYYFPIKYFTASTSLCLLFRSPLDMLRGLALPTRRSPDLRVPIFYLVLCSPPPRHARGLGHANIRVARPVGFYFSCVCSSFNCLTLVMSIRCCVVAKPGS